MFRPLAVVLGIVCVTLACWTPRSGVTAADGRDTDSHARSIELRLDRTTETDDLALTWTSIEDSRCPQGVTCIWAGEVTVRIRVREGGDDREIALTLGARPGSDTVKTSRHELRLSDVSPYPREGAEVARDDHRAIVMITRH